MFALSFYRESRVRRMGVDALELDNLKLKLRHGISTTIWPPWRKGRIPPPDRARSLSRLCFRSLLARVAASWFLFSFPTSTGKRRASIVSAQRLFRWKQMTGRIKTVTKTGGFSSLKLIYVTIIFNNAKKARTPSLSGGSCCCRSSRTFCRFCFFYVRLSSLTRVDRSATKGSCYYI